MNQTESIEHAREAIKAMPKKGDKKYTKSRVANGKALLTGVDGRNGWVRRCKDIIADYISDLGGLENTSAAERSIIRRISVMEVELELLEKQFAITEANKQYPSKEYLDLYQRTAGNLKRLLGAVGISRRAKDVNGEDRPLQKILAEAHRQQQEAASADAELVDD